MYRLKMAQLNGVVNEINENLVRFAVGEVLSSILLNSLVCYVTCDIEPMRSGGMVILFRFPFHQAMIIIKNERSHQ